MAKGNKALRVEEALQATVRNFQKGKGFWIADFRENKQENFKIEKEDKISFDVFLPGTQETKEARLLSRIYEFWINPKYRVGVFFLTDRKKINKKTITSLFPKIWDFMERETIRWSWVYLFVEEADEEFKEFIENLFAYRIGIILGEVKTEKTYYSPTFLGKEGKKLVRFRDKKWKERKKESVSTSMGP